jgi:rhodanese-related sulfurtransferase
LSSYTSISLETLARTVGTGHSPVLVDVRSDEDFAAEPKLIPGAIRRDASRVGAWIKDLAGKQVVCICRQGHGLSQGAAAWLRHEGIDAVHLAGGFEGWRDAGQLLTQTQAIPQRNSEGYTVWVTRERPKVDRIACPWLVRRFVDPGAVFLFVAPPQVTAVAESFGATPFDIEGVHWSHRGEKCTFDVMVEEFGLATKPLLHLATIVGAADTARLDLLPEAPGLIAASLGLSRMYDDDLAQLEAGMGLYDAFYRWCRDATGETHNWPPTRRVWPNERRCRREIRA